MRVEWAVAVGSCMLAGACDTEGGFRALPEPSGRVAVEGLGTISRTDSFLFVQPTSEVADILFVPDGSGSMDDDLEMLRAQFPAFMTIIDESTLDYRVGVLDSVPTKARIGDLIFAGPFRWVDRRTPDPIGVFSQMMTQATNDGTHGHHLQAIFTCLEPERGQCHRFGFRRERAPIHAIVITDEDDQSGVSLNDFVRRFRSLTDMPNDRSLSAIVDPGDGDTYPTAVALLGGVLVDIHDADYTRVLDQFARSVVDSAKQSEFYLSGLPVVDTITIRLVDEVSEEVEGSLGSIEGWTYDATSNAVLLLEPLDPGEFEVRVTYDLRSEAGR